MKNPNNLENVILDPKQDDVLFLSCSSTSREQVFEQTKSGGILEDLGKAFPHGFQIEILLPFTPVL